MRTIISPRFFKALALLGFLYIFATEFLYRRIPLFYERMVGVCARAIVRGLKINLVCRVHCKEPFPAQAIYICNHSSSFEIFMLPGLLAKTDFVMTAEALKVPFLRRIFKKAPLIFVKSKSFRERNTSFQQIRAALSKGRNLMLFPEGYSHKYLRSHFEKGAFQAAFESGVPIMPIYLQYDELDVFVPDATVNHKSEFLRIVSAPQKKVTAHFFERILPENYSSVHALRAAVYAQYLSWQKHFYGVDHLGCRDVH